MRALRSGARIASMRLRWRQVCVTIAITSPATIARHPQVTTHNGPIARGRGASLLSTCVPNARHYSLAAQISIAPAAGPRERNSATCAKRFLRGRKLNGYVVARIVIGFCSAVAATLRKCALMWRCAHNVRAQRRCGVAIVVQLKSWHPRAVEHVFAKPKRDVSIVIRKQML